MERPVYFVYQQGISADFNGEVVGVSYWSLNENVAFQDGPKISGSALETALAFGDVLMDVGLVFGTPQDDLFRGGESDDRFSGADGNDRLLGAQGADLLDGAGGNDVLEGGEGDDRLDGGEGDDILDGGAGFDTALFSGSASHYAFAAGADGIRISGPDGDDLLIDVERMEFADGSWIEASINAPAAPTQAAARSAAGATPPSPRTCRRSPSPSAAGARPRR